MASYCHGKIGIQLNCYGLGQFVELLNICCWSCLPEIRAKMLLDEQEESGGERTDVL